MVDVNVVNAQFAQLWNILKLIMLFGIFGLALICVWYIYQVMRFKKE